MLIPARVGPNRFFMKQQDFTMCVSISALLHPAQYFLGAFPSICEAWRTPNKKRLPPPRPESGLRPDFGCTIRMSMRLPGSMAESSQTHTVVRLFPCLHKIRG